MRWLLPVIAVLALLGQSVAAWAASGTFGEPSCCCPAPKECKCHDHGPPKPAEMRRCTGEATHVAPAPLVAELPSTFAIDAMLVVARVTSPEPLPIPIDRAEPPEPPPF